MARVAAAVLDEALSLIEHHEERYFLSEILRLKGSAILALDESRARPAEECYINALELAKSQSAMSFSLRAAVGLSRLWIDQDRGTDACDLLTPNLPVLYRRLRYSRLEGSEGHPGRRGVNRRNNRFGS